MERATTSGQGRRALVVYAHPEGSSLCATLAHAAVRGLERGGAQVVLLDLYADGFVPAMSEAERRVYESEQPILDPLVQRYADFVKWCDTLVVVYPTWNMGMPAILKGWFERVFVAGVAFALPSPESTILGGLNHITRFVGVSTYGAPRTVVRLTTDHGRRLITRCVRLMSTRPGRRTKWLGLYGLNNPEHAEVTGFIGRVERAMEQL